MNTRNIVAAYLVDEDISEIFIYLSISPLDSTKHIAWHIVGSQATFTQ